MSEPRLAIQNVSLSYANGRGGKTDAAPTVKEVSLQARPGELMIIVGPNGCGKSTLLRAVARLHRPDSGRILLEGEDVWSLSRKQAATRLALLPQTPTAPEGIRVADLVRHGRHPHQGLFRQWASADEDALRRALLATDTADLMDAPLDHLSGGQRQRCWLAMALAQETNLLLLDEPISMLDLGHQVEVLNLVRDLSAKGITIMMVLHDLIAAARYADTLTAMREGRVVASGPPREILTRDMVRELYNVDAHILSDPDGNPVVTPAVGGAFSSLSPSNSKEQSYV
ncbi:ABC transporter ATP-binding protein [Hahella sp. CR1]|uniref:ABC transporter ATP-binding protein n=1 Tax=Hahella sp. CR1 TaxID=2992807 RepID=UPI00244209AC|nr:ABC transporter ATP-binding protein [Hahella sp. CR1]MDG9666906.1 ABC transporter ATP-binding protein [Hahella sp. CR1]